MPTFTLQPSGSTFISRYQPYINFSNNNYLITGMDCSSKNVYRTLLKFNIPELPEKCDFISATLRLYINEVTCANQVYLRVGKIINDFDPTYVTWSDAPQMIPKSRAYLIDFIQVNKFVDIDVSDLIREEYLSPSSDCFGIAFTETYNGNGIVIFNAGSNVANNHAPTLSIQYLCSGMPGPQGPQGLQGLEGPQGPQGPQGSDGFAATETIRTYGGIFGDTTQMLTLEPSVTAEIPAGQVMPNNNIIIETNSIFITEAGDYKIDFSAMLKSVSESFVADIGVQVNGVFIKPLFITTVLSDKFSNLSLGAIISMQDGDKLTIAISTLSGGSVLFAPCLNASLSVLRVSG